MFHNGSNCDYEGQLECLRENTEKYTAFFVPVEKATETIKYKNNI